jgi:hypothetical protein
MKTLEKTELSVNETKDYFLFKQLSGNRDINELNKNRLIKSFKTNYLISPIIVNENYEIIDGQHRFEAAKELNLPIFYIVVPFYGIKEVQVLNANQKNWITNDYCDGYINMGKMDYKIYREFKRNYDMPTTQTIEILRDKKSGGSENTNALMEFKNGDFKVKDIKRATDVFDKITLISEYYDGYKRVSFVATMITLLKNKNFNFKEFVNKIQHQGGKLVDCTSVYNYTLLIEEIYNFKRREKVNLRF